MHAAGKVGFSIRGDVFAVDRGQGIAAGKDLFAEKPFGIDLAAAEKITAASESSGRFVRCSSEFPYFPGVQRVVKACQENKMGRLLEIRSGFHHSSVAMLPR